MMDVKISLILPTYNSGSTLQKALESVRLQSWHNLEVIVVDGNSNDGTLKIAESFRDLINIIVSEPDDGVYDAINKGISLATGDLIGVLGSDDELTSDALRTIASAWDSTHADIIAGLAIMVSADGSETLRPDENFGIGALLSGIPFCHNAMFATRNAYGLVGYYDQQHYQICADADWVHRAIRAGCTCQQLKVPVVRFSLGGLSSTNPDQTLLETYQIISGNFPELSLKDAEYLFRAVRNRSDSSKVHSVLRRHKQNSDLILAFNEVIRALPHKSKISTAVASLLTRLQKIWLR
jgi:glycosyltransferase involved in cell wall biosynthesis